MPRAHEEVALDVAVADQASIVWTVIIDDDQLAGVEPSYCNRTCTVTRGNDMTQWDEADLVQLWPAIVRVITQHVDHLGMDRGHATTVEGRSDSCPRRR